MRNGNKLIINECRWHVDSSNSTRVYVYYSNISLVWYVATQSADHRLNLHIPKESADESNHIRMDAFCGSDADGGVGAFQLQWNTDPAIKPNYPDVPISAIDGSTSTATTTLSRARYLGVTVPQEMSWKAKDPFTQSITNDMYSTVMKQRQNQPQSAARQNQKAPPPQQRVVGLLPNRLNSGAPPPLPNDPNGAATASRGARAGTPQNLVYVQQFFTLPFTVDLVMIPAHQLSGAAGSGDAATTKKAKVTANTLPLTDRNIVSKWFDDARTSFERRFDETFPLKSTSSSTSVVSAEEREFAMAALSNMLGGIGYFHGSSLIKTGSVSTAAAKNKNDPNAGVSSGPVTSLLTAVPSRSFFPRGFLWDEGFHQLLVGRWDPNISIDVFKHWVCVHVHWIVFCILFF
jgi:hypothetical protein